MHIWNKYNKRIKGKYPTHSRVYSNHTLQTIKKKNSTKSLTNTQTNSSKWSTNEAQLSWKILHTCHINGLFQGKRQLMITLDVFVILALGQLLSSLCISKHSNWINENRFLKPVNRKRSKQFSCLPALGAVVRHALKESRGYMFQPV